MRVLFFIFVSFVFTAAAQTPFKKGNNLAKTGDFAAALKNYRQAELMLENEKAGDNSLAQIHYNIGVCLYRLKQPERAVEEFNRAIKLSGRNYPKAFYARGMAQIDLNNRREAEASFLDALKLETANGEAWFDLALVYLAEKDFDSAEKAFQNSVRFKTVSAADAHNNLGVIYALKNDWDRAAKEFQTALKESGGESVEAQNNLQLCKFYAQNFNRDLVAKLRFGVNHKE